MARSVTLDMTQGSLGRQIIGFSLPLMFTNLLQMLFSMVDLAVVGRFSSSAAMGSVGSTTTLIFLFTGFLMGLGSGVNVLVATHFGARSEKKRARVRSHVVSCLPDRGLFDAGVGPYLCPPAARASEHAQRSDRRRGAVPSHLLPWHARRRAL